MRLAALVSLTMLAFASNSILNRMGVEQGQTDPLIFAAIRCAAAVVVLWAIALWRHAPRPDKRIGPGVALAVYLLGFSVAYLALDAGPGALILFATVQITMFAAAVLRAEVIPPVRWVGTGLALVGLVFLLLPGAKTPPLWAALAMVLAGAAWGVYTLAGRAVAAPIPATAWNFTVALPLVALPVVVLPGPVTWAGAMLAVVAGAVTSGLGYALWFAVLPALERTTAAIAQLTVPVIAIALGVVLLSEDLTVRAVLAAGMVLAGSALALVTWRRGD